MPDLLCSALLLIFMNRYKSATLGICITALNRLKLELGLKSCCFEKKKRKTISTPHAFVMYCITLRISVGLKVIFLCHLQHVQRDS